jgi:hypothetical protein
LYTDHKDQKDEAFCCRFSVVNGRSDDGFSESNDGGGKDFLFAGEQLRDHSLFNIL